MKHPGWVWREGFLNSFAVTAPDRKSFVSETSRWVKYWNDSFIANKSGFFPHLRWQQEVSTRSKIL